MKRAIMFFVLFFVTTIIYSQNEFIAKVNSDSVVVGTSRIQMPTNLEARWVQFMHEHATAKVYIGGEDVVVLNGFGALQNLDTTERYVVQNTNVFYLISDTPGVVVKYMWGD